MNGLSQEALGQRLLWMKKDFPEQSMSDLADILYIQIRDGYANIPENPKNESMGTETAKVYRQHLREQGDRYSLEMLEALEKGIQLSEDPGGN